MIFVKDDIPKWIKPFAEFGPGIKLDIKINHDNFFWYLQAMCSPPNFEKYLILLHPFWINYKAEKLNKTVSFLREKDINDEDFKRLTYFEFFKKYNEEFKLETAKNIKEKIADKYFREDNDWPKYIWYPAEGEAEFSDLEFIIQLLIKNYGDLESDFFYSLLKTKESLENKILRGKLSELPKVLDFEPEISNSPNAIYPTKGNDWFIITDYDCPMTFIGGKAELINEILRNKPNGIDLYEIKPKYQGKATHNH
ncbi:hypothetical protein F7018_01100 [Tenacibaculum aiptasiae]|uniref:Uncharacterized protein n=1 Tax=Tenacibaculum aiptasiae TaxID=426481 RepID=A0A7J5AS92_9FLAO|nr:hypothetical protein [Tenacibaculum aiptasiae]KAB1160503.1 hypothetical protein F7018_01100 [Tenacibaculum aiptasiae]